MINFESGKEVAKRLGIDEPHNGELYSMFIERVMLAILEKPDGYFQNQPKQSEGEQHEKH